MNVTYSPNNFSFWDKQNPILGSNSILPPQAVPARKKNDKWKRATMDALERIGVKQLRENLRFKDFYRMIEGKMAFSELSETFPQFREIEKAFNQMQIPANIKHYDLIGGIINLFAGEVIENTDKFGVATDDEISENEYVREKTELLHKYIDEQFSKEVKLRLIANGINPDKPTEEFESEEEAAQYKQMVQQQIKEKTPEEIERYMSKTWKVAAVDWAEHTLEQDHIRFYHDEKDRNEFIDFLATGRCFRHFRLGYDYYAPETWSPLNTFFSQDLDTKYVQDGEYVGRVHFYTPNQIVAKYGHLLTRKEKEVLLGTDSYESKVLNLTDEGSKGNQTFSKNLFQFYEGMEILPFEQYHEYEHFLELQENTGAPMGWMTFKDADGNERQERVFLPSINDFNSYSRSLANSIRNDLQIRGDLVQVVEAYWVSYELVGLLTYETEDGRLSQEIISEELLPEYIKEYDIKQLSNVSISEAEEDPKADTIVWDYIPVVYQGVKINQMNTRLKKSLYLQVGATEYQIKGDSNVYDVKLPVAGLIDHSLAEKIFPLQVGYNIALNQVRELMAKEMGVFFMFDVQWLPSEFKEWNNTNKTLTHLHNLIKSTGLFVVDSSKQNLAGGGIFNQFSAQDLTFTNQILARFQVAETYKRMAYEKLGVNPQRLGQAIKYETAEGVKQSQDASYAQTEVIFDKFSQYKKRMLEIHLNVAQYAQKNDKDITVYYTKSDTEKAFLKFSDPYFQLRKFDIIPTTSSKQRKLVEMIRQYLLNNNTMGSDEFAVAKLLTSDTLVSLIETARMERVRREQMQQQEQQNLLQQEQQKAELAEQAAQKDWERYEYSKQKDRENAIKVKIVDAAGRAADNNADEQQIQKISTLGEMYVKQEQMAADISMKQKQLEIDENDKLEARRLDWAKLNNEIAQLEQRKREDDTKRYVATINKN